MAPQPLELQHHAGKGFRVYFASFTQMADLPVLTEHAEEIAIGHKDGPGTVGPYQGIFLSKMRIETRHHGWKAGTTNTFLTLQPVDFTLAGAKTAIFKNLVRLFYAGGEPSGLMGFNV
jgi:hypothetical protein